MRLMIHAIVGKVLHIYHFMTSRLLFSVALVNASKFVAGRTSRKMFHEVHFCQHRAVLDSLMVLRL